jgi:hypothetical protein
MTAHLMSFIFILIFINPGLKEVVKEFHQLESEAEEINFIDKYKNYNDPSILAYVVSISMKQAEYSRNPYTKLKVFNTNKNKLDSLIKHYTLNIHLRYIRLLTQEKTPSILGYNDNLKEDKSFLRKKLQVEDESDFLDSYIIANTSL